MAEYDPEILTRRWVHSHEEDTPDHLVYRPEAFAFPPARGRSGFDLNPDGTMFRVAPGPTDRTAIQSGRWAVEEGGTLALYPEDSPTPHRIGKIAALSPDRLVIERVS